MPSDVNFSVDENKRADATIVEDFDNDTSRMQKKESVPDLGIPQVSI